MFPSNILFYKIIAKYLIRLFAIILTKYPIEKILNIPMKDEKYLPICGS